MRRVHLPVRNTATILDNPGRIGYIAGVSAGVTYRPPETILLNGVVHPSADDGPAVEGLAIAAGRIVAVGSTIELRQLAGPATTVVDLAGRTVLPSFVDSHTHFQRTAILRQLYLDFASLEPTSVADVLAHVGDRAVALPSGAWIQGDSLTAAALAEGRLPNRAELDRVARGHPVVLRGIGKHVVAANSAALAAAGIDRRTGDPPGGRIERDADGEPTGILHERAKLRLDTSHPETVVPGPSADERRRALRAGFSDLHRLGITTIHEMVRLPDEAADFAAIRAAGELGVRTRFFYRVHESPITLEHLTTLGIRRGLGDDWLRILGVKISVDGWCIFRNAAVYQPYCDEPDNTGLLRIEPQQLTDLTVAANRQGLGIAIHAVGARAVDAALEAFDAAGPAIAGPYRLEHGHLDVGDRQLQRMRDLGVTWSVQPAFLVAYRRDWEAALEPDRIDRILPLRRAETLGIRTLHNSDVPSGPQSPLDSIRAAVGRPGSGAGNGEGVSIRSAWRSWTTVPSTDAGEEAVGPLEVGRAADLVVFDRDPLQSSIDELADLPVRATMIEGRFVSGADGVAS